MKFWGQKHTRFVGLIPLVMAILFARHIAQAVGIRPTGIESSWQVWVAYIFLLWGAINLFLAIGEYIWKALKIPQS